MSGTQKKYSFKRKGLPCNTITYRPLWFHLHCSVTTVGLLQTARPQDGVQTQNCHIRGPSCRSVGSHHCWEEHILRADVSWMQQGMTFPVTAWSKSGMHFRFPTTAFLILCQKLQRDGTPISSSSSWSASGWIWCSYSWIYHTHISAPQFKPKNICYCTECLVCEASTPPHQPVNGSYQSGCASTRHTHNPSSLPGFSNPPVPALTTGVRPCSQAQHKTQQAAVSAQPWHQVRSGNHPSPKLRGVFAPFEHWKTRGTSRAEIIACEGCPTLLVTAFSFHCPVTPPLNFKHLHWYKGILLQNASKAHSSFLEIRLKRTNFCAPIKYYGKLSSTSFLVLCFCPVLAIFQMFLLVSEKHQDTPKKNLQWFTSYRVRFRKWAATKRGNQSGSTEPKSCIIVSGQQKSDHSIFTHHKSVMFYLFLWKFTFSIKNYASHVDGHFWSPGKAWANDVVLRHCYHLLPPYSTYASEYLFITFSVVALSLNVTEGKITQKLFIFLLSWNHK